MRWIAAVLVLVLGPWFLYANQTEQKFKCAAYELTSRTPGFPDNVTCLLNGVHD